VKVLLVRPKFSSIVANGVCFKINGNWTITEKGGAVNSFITRPDRTTFYKGIFTKE